MVVQHNLQAMNSNRLLNITTNAQASSTEKLSSGYRINRAADDAAGLTISEKMRKQIRGLDQASTNAQDGVSAVQTAEGALTEVHDMLQRMNELATQAANGTNSESDRQAIQDEIDQLTTEIDRVAETTKFNEIYLLKGDEGTKKVNMQAHDAGLAGKLVDNGNGTATFTMNELNDGDTVEIGGTTYTIVGDGGDLELLNGSKATDYGTVGEGTAASISNSIADTNVTVGGTYTGTEDQELVYMDGTETLTNGIDTVVSAAGWYTKASVETAKTDDEAVTDEAIDVSKLGVDIDQTNGTLASGDTLTLTAAVAAEYTAFADEDEMEAAIESGSTIYKGDASTTAVEGTDYNYTAAEKELTVLDGSAKNYGTVSDGTAKCSNDQVTVTGTYTGTDDQELVYTDGNQTCGDNGSVTITKGWYTKDSLAAALADTTATDESGLGLVKGDTSGLTIDDTSAANGDTLTLTAGEYTAFTSEAQMEAALESGSTIYKGDASTEAVEDTDYTYETVRADNEITAEEAYELAEAELLQANQIGDTNGTAAVTRPSAADAATTDTTATEKTADDYAVGDTVTVGDTTYTVGTDADTAKAAITDAITAAEGVTTPTTVKDGDSLAKVGSVSDGNTTINIFMKSDNSLVYTSASDVQYDGTSGNIKGVSDSLTSSNVDALCVAGATVTFTPASGNETTTAVTDDKTVISADKAAELENAAAKAEADEAAAEAAAAAPGPNVFNITVGSATVAKTLSFNLHVGADADMTNKIGVNIETMNCSYLGIKNLDVVGNAADGNDGGIAATYAIDAIADAIAKVSEQRSALGAVQNRLEHTINNLDNVVENTTSAESRIRDTDMAEEMVEYSKNNILAQAGQAMLAQANQANQGVLSLLG